MSKFADLKSLKNVIINDGLPGVLFLAVSFLVLIQSPLSPFTGGGLMFDSGIFVYTGWRMTEGSLPYRDTWDNKGPLLYFINMFGIMLHPDHGVWAIELMFLFASSCLLYKTLLLLTSKNISIIGTVYILFSIGGLLEGGNFTEEFSLPFSFAALYLFMKIFLENQVFTSARSFLIGSTFAATILLRPNIATVWIGFCLVSVLVLLRRNVYRAFQFTGLFLAGVVITFLPFTIYLFQNNIFDDYFHAAILVPMQFESVSILHRLKTVGNLLFITNMTNGILLLAVYFWLRDSRLFKSPNSMSHGIRMMFIASFLTFIVNCYANSLSGYTFVHYALSFVPVLALPAVMTISKMVQWIQSRRLNRDARFATVYVALLLLVISIPSLSMQFYQLTQNKDLQTPIEKFVIDHSSQQDTIQVFSKHVDLYYKTRRVAASRFPYILDNGVLHDDFESAMLSTIFDDVMANKPEIIVMSIKHEKYIARISFPIGNMNQFFEFLGRSYLLEETINENKIYRLKSTVK